MTVAVQRSFVSAVVRGLSGYKPHTNVHEIKCTMKTSYRQRERE